MLQKLLRIGSLSALIAVVACAEAPPPPPGQPGQQGQQGQGSAGPKPGEQTATVNIDKDGEGPSAPMAAEKRGKGATGARAGAGEGAIGGAANDQAIAEGDTGIGAALAPRAIAPVELGPWTGGSEIDMGEGAKSPVPVTVADPSWGSPKALVTIVEFSDLQCPFCARANGTIKELQRIYGKDQLRVVWKNFPLEFHKDARPAAEAAMALYKVKGAPWFFAYQEALFSDRIDKPVVDGLLPRAFGRKDADLEIQKGDVGKKIDEDIALGKQLGVQGTPAFFINGVFLSGAQPVESFRAIIDEQIAAARKATASGTAPEKVYLTLSTQNYKKPSDRPSPGGGSAAPPEDTKTVWRVPVDGSPVKGKNNALVTMVMFTDFQCPFCIRVAPTVEQLARDYGDKLRIVYKNNPLPFHKRAAPAAELALEARAQKGDAGFWKMHDLLFAANGKLEDADLLDLAKSAGLDVKKVKDALEKGKYASRIEQDQDLADDVQASGTPHFFINGRRLVGAQPLEKFKALIDEEITNAEATVKKGTSAAKLYDTLIKDGKTATLEKKTVPAPTKDSPSRGPANAKVVVQIFSDFQCPFCQRVEGTLKELDEAFPGKLRFVWRNLPLPFHKNAMPAAIAAMEAYKQKGPEAFWKMHDAFFQDQGKLDRAGIEQTAISLGLDSQKLLAALDNETHKALVEADMKIAEDAGIRGTPGFVINGYFISGAQPIAKFKKVVNRALKEAK